MGKWNPTVAIKLETMIDTPMSSVILCYSKTLSASSFASDIIYYLGKTNTELEMDRIGDAHFFHNEDGFSP